MLRIIVSIFTGIMLSSPAMAQSSSRSLDGEWLFKADEKKIGMDEEWFGVDTDLAEWSTVNTPKFWEDYPGMASYDGWGWFTREFDWQAFDEPMSIHFAGVDDDAWVWINGVQVGNHSGYSDPFVFNVSGALRHGKNRVTVLVADNSGGGGMYKPITLVETSRVEELLRSAFSTKPARRSADWVTDATVYSVYLRSFSPEGTFKGLEARIPELKELGITVIWLMPIHPVGELKRKGSLGSPYAVRDYYAVNPEFGTKDDFKDLVRTIHANGMRVIIDLVINHTSWDNSLMTKHPDWYTRDASGAVVAPNADWTDVADLDFSNSDLRTYMKEMMIWWVRVMSVDGFRCDVAEMVPTDFWEDARADLDRVKPIMMLSEGSLPEHHVKAFDLTYAWNFYDALEPVLKSRRPVALIDQLFRNEELQFPRGSLRMRFNTNHDKNAWDAPAIKKFGEAGVKLSAVLMHTIPGVPMIYTGEEVANDRRLDLFEKVDIDWNRPREMGDLYRTLHQLRAEHKAVSRGEMLRVQASPEPSVYAFFRVLASDVVFVAMNFSNSYQRAAFQVPESGLFNEFHSSLSMKELFSGDELNITPETRRVAFSLSPFGYKVFVVAK